MAKGGSVEREVVRGLNVQYGRGEEANFFAQRKMDNPGP